MPKLKMPNGYGSIVKLKGNRRKPYMVRITTELTPEGKQIRKVLGYFAKEKEALIFLANYNEHPFDVSNIGITFTELYEKWAAETYKGEPTPNSYVAAYKRCSRLYDRQFVELKTADFQQAIDECELGYSTKKNIKILCNLMTKYALANDVVNKNYVELCKLPPQEESRIHRPFSTAEINKLWEMVDMFPIIRYVLCLIYTGLRPTELLKIEKANVHLGEQYMMGGIKTEAGKNRVIPIHRRILPFIADLMADTNNTSEYLMYDEEKKKPYNYDRFRDHLWEPALNKLPIEMRDHLPHDGRHTCTTLLDNAEPAIAPKIIKLILGHASKDVTEKIYTHKTINQLIESINKI